MSERVAPPDVLLDIRRLKKYFNVRKGLLHAVDDVSLTIRKGRTLGLVGESGCGKSTLGRVVIGLIEATGGEVFFHGSDALKFTAEQRSTFRTQAQIVFQDPFSSLDPRRRIGPQIADGMDIHGLASGAEQAQRVGELLARVGLDPAHAQRFPHEFSGGQRQRIGIARALIVEPEFIIADEPISALDMSIRAQVLNLLRHLQKERGITYLFIAHDLSVMRYISDRIAVIHKGDIVELADAEELVTHAIHPYTRSLLSAIPMPNPRLERKKKLLVYDPAMHDYTAAPPAWRELRPRHWVLCNDAEAEKWLAGSGTI